MPADQGAVPAGTDAACAAHSNHDRRLRGGEVAAAIEADFAFRADPGVTRPLREGRWGSQAGNRSAFELRLKFVQVLEHRVD